MLGRQELEAELLEDTPGALWSHGSIEASRLRLAPDMTRVVVAIDPAVTSGEEADETGIWPFRPMERPLYAPSKRRLTWPNGALATTYSADEPERLRGPQHDAAWSAIRWAASDRCAGTACRSRLQGSVGSALSASVHAH